MGKARRIAKAAEDLQCRYSEVKCWATTSIGWFQVATSSPRCCHLVGRPDPRRPSTRRPSALWHSRRFLMMLPIPLFNKLIDRRTDRRRRPC